MKMLSKSTLISCLALGLAVAVVSSVAEEKSNPTKEFMKKYHKAPQGTDPVMKRAAMGKATPAELKELAAGYKAMTTAKPPRGEMASWKEKTSKAAAAAEALVKGDPDALERFKNATNCKACHSEHKPE